MELRSRSRSRTPFLQLSSEDEVTQGANQVYVTRSSRKSAHVTSSTEVSSSSAEQFYSTNRQLRSSGSLYERIPHKTSDYSSEEGEVEVQQQISQNQKNQIIEDAKRAANGSTEVSALNLYLKADRYWDKYPKTDWTYSPHSRDRVEIAPGVVQMPNMSRRTIHSQDSATNTESSWFQRFRQQQKLSQNNNLKITDDSAYKITRVSAQKRTILSRITTVIVTVFTSIYWFFSSIYQVQNSGVVWLAKKLHRLASRLMLVDTWLLQKSPPAGSKISKVVALCLLPLFLLAGLHALWARGVTLAPFCHPNCGTVALSYYQKLIN